MELIRHEMQQLPILFCLCIIQPTVPWRSGAGNSSSGRPSTRPSTAGAKALGISRRAFTRLFRRETGLSFMAWRQQAFLPCAMPHLAAGEPVTTVAMDLGYENPAAFTIVFKRAFGSLPWTISG